MIPNVLKNVFSQAGKVIAPATSFSGSSGLISGGVRMATTIGGVAAANKVFNLRYGKRKIPVAPGTQIITGKRGIDANHLNTAGIGLAMHKNRRKF